MLPTCRTSPRRLVPVGTSGLRLSYSDSPSSFQSITSRAVCRYSCRSAFASEVGTAAVCHRSVLCSTLTIIRKLEFVGGLRGAGGVLFGFDELLELGLDGLG